MHKITVFFFDTGFKTVVNPNDDWNMKGQFNLDLGQAVVVSFSPFLDTDDGVFQSFLVSDITIAENVIFCIFFGYSYPPISLKQELTITIRSMKPYNLFPQNLNVRDHFRDKFVIINFCVMKNNEYEYKTTKVLELNMNSIKSAIEKILKTSKLSTVDYDLAYFDDQDGNIVITDVNHIDIVADGRKVLNIGVKAEKLINFYLDQGKVSKKVEIDYLPLIPKKILIWALNNLRTGDENQKSLKRRLVRLACNSALPADLLLKIVELGLSRGQFQRASLPFSSWAYHQGSILNNPMTQDALRCACSNMNPGISEASLRVRVWDSLIKSFVSDVNCFESEFHVKKILNLPNVVKVDLALFLKHVRVPVFIAEVVKENSADGHEHKDFVKLGATLSASCLKLAHSLKCRGRNPLEARTLGTWIGYSKFKFVVASPQIKVNEERGREEIFVNLTSYDHWSMDLLSPSTSTNCTSVCCSAQPGTLDIIAPTLELNLETASLTDRTNIVLIDEPTQAQEDEEAATQAQVPVQLPTQIPGVTYNMEAVCKLKIFIECANQAASQFEALLNLPVRPNADDASLILFPSEKPIILKSLGSGSSNTPEKNRVRFYPDLDVSGNNMDLNIGILEKPASREIDVYRAIPTPFKIFFPLLHNFCVHPEDSKTHVFKIEMLQPLFEDDCLGSMIRNRNLRELLLESATFAVNILFEMLILHEKVGYVHSDVSPKNIMFSERLKIWKLMDFDLSLPVEESLKTSRRAGTSDYQAPESIRTGIWTQASDVFALGQVVQEFFCHEMKKYECEESELQAFNDFNDLVKKLCANDPDQRLSVRTALKRFIDFVFKYEVQYLPLYGYHLIFPLALEELKNTPPISPASSNEVPITCISVKNYNHFHPCT